MRRLTTPGWLLKHALAIVLVVGCLWLGWWQIGRAAGGNALSFGYSIEWPFFAGFVVFMWVREVRLTLYGHAPAAAEPRPAEPQPAQPPVDKGAAVDRTPVKAFDVDAALAHRAAADTAALDAESTSDYNQYLAWLAEHPDVSPGDLRRAARAATKETTNG